jgi:DNA repair exonuclease SbcCD ATPase subunit
MTINIAELRQRVKSSFSHVEQVGPSVLRFTRKTADLPFAVYYLDVGQELPDTKEALTTYQDRVIGRSYFQGTTSLQWNNYLYFVINQSLFSKSDVRAAKELIESDRNYARKRVISDADLDSVLTPTVVSPTLGPPRENVMSVWTKILVEANLDKAILSDEDLPKRLALIESPPKKSTFKPTLSLASNTQDYSTFVRSLALQQYREFPLQRNFQFGTVNLIFGNNGSGKTSILEAIELLYCGRNKRNPDRSAPYELVATFEDGRVENVNADRSLKLFRDRNLLWYGQPEIKTNNLYLSFAQFNFLETDAAVSMADSTSRIEEDLSKLLIGAEGSKTWRNIERVSDALSMELRNLRPNETQMQEALTDLDKRLEESSTLHQESDSIRARLNQMLARLGWIRTEADGAALSRSLVEALSELVPLTRQAAALHWTPSPVTTNGLVKYCQEAKEASHSADNAVSRLELLDQSQKQTEDATARCQEALGLIDELKQLTDAGVLTRSALRKTHETTVASYSGILAGVEDHSFDFLSDSDLSMAFPLYHQAAVSERARVEALLASAKKDYSNFSKLRDQSLNLAQELRRVAARILETTPNPVECPLCHTPFAPGELSKHIAIGTHTAVEATGQALLTRLDELEQTLKTAVAVEAASSWLLKFSQTARAPSGDMVRSILSLVEDAKATLKQTGAELETLNREILTLESQGLSIQKFEKVSSRLRNSGYALGSSPDSLDQLRSDVNQKLAASLESRDAESREVAMLQATIASTLHCADTDLASLKRELSRLKNQLATTESLRDKLTPFFTSFPWPHEKPIAELAVEADSIRTVAAELQSALGREAQAQASHKEMKDRKVYLEGQLLTLRTRIKRLATAQSVLEHLQKEHSLQGALESALRQNRSGIEAIFSHIHSPAEFAGLGPTWTSLVRKLDGSQASLTEISTGQRAALALSIFLAQNSQLTVAPPVMLIDDPIAHVDDLNALSFLDYLRDVVLQSRRQIFFATASDKLATLFERKFDFLGSSGFNRINLQRDMSLSAKH